MDAILVPWRRVDTIFDELDAVERQVAARAHDLFERRGGTWGHELEDWLEAEREETWVPPIDLREQESELVLKAAIAGVTPDQLDLRVTPDDLLIEAEVHHEHKPGEQTVHVCEFAHGKLFRRVHFPRPVDPDKVQATFKDGLLTVTAPIREKARPVEIREG